MHVTIDVRFHSPELVEAVQSLAAAIAGKTITVATQPAQTATAVEPAATTPISPSPVQAPTPAPVPTSYTPGSAPIPTSPPAVVPTAAPATPTVPTAPSPPTQAPAPTAVPTAAQTYTLDQLAVAATQLVDAGRREELVQLLASFGVQALTALPKEQYGAFATALRQMGAKI